MPVAVRGVLCIGRWRSVSLPVLTQGGKTVPGAKTATDRRALATLHICRFNERHRQEPFLSEAEL